MKSCIAIYQKNNVEPYSHNIKDSFLTYSNIITHTITAGMILAENIPY